MLSATLLSLREGLEAALIVGILLGTLNRLGRRDQFRTVWLGVLAAGGVSLLAALALTMVGRELEGRAEQVFEAVTLLLAAAVLTWMIFWMQRAGRGMSARLASEVRQASGGAAAGGLFLVAFLAVVREGVELALFLTAATFTSSAGETLVGGVLGLTIAGVLGALLYLGVVRLNVKRFFRITSVFLIVVAAGMVAHGLHELIEASVVPAIVDPVYNINPFLSDGEGIGLLLQTLFGYNGNPALTESVAYIAYFVVIWLVLRRSERLAAVSG